MARYSIEDTTLTSIADALRDKNNGWEEVIVGYDETRTPIVKVSKTPNATSFTEYSGSYANSLTQSETVTIEGAVSLEVNVAYQSESTNYDYLIITSGKTASTSGTKLGGSSRVQMTYTYNNTDSVSFYFKSDGSNGNYLGYYAEVRGFDADGNQIEEVIQIPIYETQASKEYKPTEMADAIHDLPTLDKFATYTIVGQQNAMFSLSNWSQEKYIRQLLANSIINKTIQTENLTTLYRACYNTTYGTYGVTVDDFPELNMDGTVTEGDLREAFYLCDLRRLPKINWNGYTVYAYNLDYLCNQSKYLENVDSLKGITVKSGLNNSWKGYLFYYCYALRSIPVEFWRAIQGNVHSNTFNYFYIGTLTNCRVLDEVTEFPVLGNSSATKDSNLFSSTFDDCRRLKRLTFAVQEDGTPYVRKWSNQTMDLADFGYGNGILASSISSYSTTISLDKKVTDDASYQALKDDPDWWTEDSYYSRYGKASAIETISTLPDVSSGSKNVVKFCANGGLYTDQGNIGSLTEEEIAVATAKGWTVTLV